MGFQERVPIERQKGTEIIKQAYLEHERARDPMPMPPWIGQLKDKVHQTALHFARKAYRETERFFYIPNAYLKPGLPWDEVTTNHIFARLLQRLTNEELPDYSPENHRRAIEWWLSWQNRKTGAFHNPIYVDPQNPSIVRKKDPTYEARDVNAKYLPAVLRLLGTEPLLPAQMHGSAEAGEIDYDEFWKKVVDEAYYNHGGIMVNAMLHDIADGKADRIPAVEFAVSYTVDRIDPALGILPSTSRDWSTYAAMEPTLKTYGRLIGQQAVENLPPDRMKRFTDFIVANQPAFVSHGDAGNMANTSQLFGLSLPRLPRLPAAGRLRHSAQPAAGLHRPPATPPRFGQRKGHGLLPQRDRMGHLPALPRDRLHQHPKIRRPGNSGARAGWGLRPPYRHGPL